jgi:3-dehydroquinate synthase
VNDRLQPVESGDRDAACAVEFTHRLRFTRGVFDPRNDALRGVLDPPDEAARRVVVFGDQGVLDAWPDLDRRLRGYAAAHPDRLELSGGIVPVPGGEQAKNDRAVVEGAVRRIYEARLCRQSTVIAIGGGAVLDAVGFAASIAHRGLRIVRLPTTTLAQGDSGVGVKNGVNAFGRKNFLGTFAPPWGVVNDFDFLGTLGDRDWRSGFAEAVKVALVKDARFFAWLERQAPKLAARDPLAAEDAVRRSALLHLDHIVAGGDPFELTLARPLDFGHWSAHKLEQMTGFELRHGEAVAAGIALDVQYACLQGRLDPAEGARVHRLLRALGFELYHPVMAGTALLDGLEEFREHLGGRLTISMVRGIGRAEDVHEIDRAVMMEAVERLAAAPRPALQGA